MNDQDYIKRLEEENRRLYEIYKTHQQLTKRHNDLRNNLIKSLYYLKEQIKSTQNESVRFLNVEELWKNRLSQILTTEADPFYFDSFLNKEILEILERLERIIDE